MRDQDRVSRIDDDQIAQTEQHHQGESECASKRSDSSAIALPQITLPSALPTASHSPSHEPTSCHQNRARTLSTLAPFSMITQSNES